MKNVYFGLNVEALAKSRIANAQTPFQVIATSLASPQSKQQMIKSATQQFLSSVKFYTKSIQPLSDLFRKRFRFLFLDIVAADFDKISEGKTRKTIRRLGHFIRVRWRCF